MPLVSDAAQIAGFLLAGWLLFRLTDWIYRRRTDPDQGSSERATVADLGTPLVEDAPAISDGRDDHGGHGPRSPAHVPRSVERR